MKREKQAIRCLMMPFHKALVYSRKYGQEIKEFTWKFKDNSVFIVIPQKDKGNFKIKSFEKCPKVLY